MWPQGRVLVLAFEGGVHTFVPVRMILERSKNVMKQERVDIPAASPIPRALLSPPQPGAEAKDPTFHGR